MTGPVRTVGQFRYALVDTLAPLATVPLLAILAGTPVAVVAVLGLFGAAVAAVRMEPYAVDAWQHRKTRR